MRAPRSRGHRIWNTLVEAGLLAYGFYSVVVEHWSVAATVMAVVAVNIALGVRDDVEWLVDLEKAKRGLK